MRWRGVSECFSSSHYYSNNYHYDYDYDYHNFYHDHTLLSLLLGSTGSRRVALAEPQSREASAGAGLVLRHQSSLKLCEQM